MIQSDIAQKFSDLIVRGRLQHAYLFSGVQGALKLETALYIAQAILCPHPPEAGVPDRTCSVCQRIEKGQHPDVTVIEPENGVIKVDTVRQLRHEFSQSGMETREKILIIQQTDTMSISATNSLLKFLEEPESHVTIFLLTDAIQKLLPTIVSRAQVISFPELTISERVQLLKDKYPQSNQASLLAHLSQSQSFLEYWTEGDFIFKWADQSWQWIKSLIQKETFALIYVQTRLIPQLADVANNRQAIHLLLDLCLLIYQDLLSLKNQTEEVLAFEKYREELRQLVQKVSYEQIAESFKIILKGKRMIDSHVQLQSVLEKVALDLLANH